MDLIEVETSGGGILSFDGQVIEPFHERTRVSAWRIHRSHVTGWEVEGRKGASPVKIMVAKRDFQNVLVDEERLPGLDLLRQAVHAARG